MAVPERRLSEILADFPPGPLDAYRKAASFDWRSLKIHVNGEETIVFLDQIWETLRREALFQRAAPTPSLPEQRRTTFLRLQRLKQLDFLPDGWLTAEQWRVYALNEALDVYDMQLGARLNLHDGVFANTVRVLGSERHQDLLDKAERLEIFGCFALSELSHASNTRAMRTEAHYDAGRRTFRFRSPDAEAAKVWAGNLGESATHAVVWAQLFTAKADGARLCHGLHPFVLQVRDTRTLRPLPGLAIGDMGEKLGWNGVDNGWLLFKDYEAPREALLNRNGDVEEDGTYVSRHRSARGRLGANLGALSSGRVGIAKQASVTLRMAVPIAVRYSAARRQFGEEGPGEEEELPVLEYPLQQYRLFPLLAHAFVYQAFTKRQLELYHDLVLRVMGGEAGAEVRELGREVHALSCCAKPMVTWAAMRAVQECREACGGHGYLKSGRLGQLRNDQDPSQTYEGDNNVLLQQTSNYLLAVAKEKRERGRTTAGPLGLTDFLFRDDADASRGQLDERDLTRSCLMAYDWLLRRLLQESVERLARERSRGASDFAARNTAQPFQLHRLSRVLLERTALSWWAEAAAAAPEGLRAVLGRLGDLYGLASLQPHLGLLYATGYARGQAFREELEGSMERLCGALKPDAVALSDAIGYPDWALHSSLGMSDGKIYENIFAGMAPDVRAESQGRAHYWQDVVAALKSKSKL